MLRTQIVTDKAVGPINGNQLIGKPGIFQSVMYPDVLIINFKTDKLSEHAIFVNRQTGCVEPAPKDVWFVSNHTYTYYSSSLSLTFCNVDI